MKYFQGNRPFQLLTNNPKKVNDLNECGLSNITPIKHVIGVGDANRDYLVAKRNWGHDLSSEDIES